MQAKFLTSYLLFSFAFLFAGAVFAKPASPPPPANNQQQACREGAIGNMLFCPDHHTVYRHQVCRHGRMVMEDVNGGEANCPGHVAQQEHPQNCADPDHSDINRMGDDRFFKSTTSGWLGSGRARRYVTRQDKCSEERDGTGNQRLTEYTCINDTDIGLRTNNCPEGEGCVLGTCAEVLIVLRRLGDPQGGWQSGKTYVLEEDFVVGGSEVPMDISNRDRHLENVVLDCRGHSIINRDGTRVIDFAQVGGTAINITFGMNHVAMEIKNCTITGFSRGINVDPSILVNLELSNLDLYDNNEGIIFNWSSPGLEAPIVPASLTVNNVRSCNNFFLDLYCLRWANEDSIINGRGNHFGTLLNCEIPHMPRNFYTGCQ